MIIKSNTDIFKYLLTPEEAMTKWTFEPGHTAAEFKVKHMMITWVRGTFKNVEGSIEFDPDNLGNASVEVVIKAEEIWSGDKARDDHLKGKDFLDVENHPTIKFKSTKVEGDKDKAKVTGDLTMRGVTKEVVLDVEFLGQWNTPYWEDGVDKGPIPRIGFVGTTKINRQDFGISWQGEMEKGGIVVGNDIYITIDVEAVPKKE